MTNECATDISSKELLDKLLEDHESLRKHALAISHSSMYGICEKFDVEIYMKNVNSRIGALTYYDKIQPEILLTEIKFIEDTRDSIDHTIHK